MFNNADVTNYFKANAKDLNTDKSFAGFVIDVNPEDKTSFESSVISDKNCVRVSIDMEAAIAAAKK